MQLKWTSIRKASLATGMDRDAISRRLRNNWVLRCPDLDPEVKRVLIVQLRRSGRAGWYLAAPPPTPEWEGQICPAGRPVMYLSKIPPSTPATTRTKRSKR